jgi:hypothetical protein
MHTLVVVTMSRKVISNFVELSVTKFICRINITQEIDVETAEINWQQFLKKFITIKYCIIIDKAKLNQ